MSKLTIILAGILLMNILAGGAFEYDDVPEYYDAAETLDDTLHDMQGEARQILLNPQRRRERRKNRIAALIEKMGLESCLFNHERCNSIDKNDINSTLTNDGPFVIWHCNCEMDYYDCLHRVNSTISNELGNLHFTLHTRCYRNDVKNIGCLKYDQMKFYKQERCIQYLSLLETPIQTRLFDSPFYHGKPIETPIYTIKNPRTSIN